MRTKLTLVCSIVCLCNLFCTPTSVPPIPVPTQTSQMKGSPGTQLKVLRVQHFLSASAALKFVVERTKPHIVGLGELHQTIHTKHIVSALNRFTNKMMPALAEEISDIVVETWQPVGCGEVERKVAAQVEEVIERPKSTESEVVTMLKKAKSLGVNPHILKVACDDYEKLFINDGGTMDAYLMLKLIARLLREKTEAVLARRLKIQGHKKNELTIEPPLQKKIFVYGGALHNDPYPEDGWDEVVFGPGLLRAVEGQYLAVDLLVPEYVDEDPDNVKERWYPLFQKHASEKQVTLIEVGPNTFHLILKKNVRNEPSLPALKK